MRRTLSRRVAARADGVDTGSARSWVIGPSITRFVGSAVPNVIGQVTRKCSAQPNLPRFAEEIRARPVAHGFHLQTRVLGEEFVDGLSAAAERIVIVELH